jgi:hypothetical protein
MATWIESQESSYMLGHSKKVFLLCSNLIFEKVSLKYLSKVIEFKRKNVKYIYKKVLGNHTNNFVNVERCQEHPNEGVTG